MSIMTFVSLFWLTNWGRWVKHLALQIRGEKQFKKEGGNITLKSGRDMSRCVFVISHTGSFLRSQFVLRKVTQYPATRYLFIARLGR